MTSEKLDIEKDVLCFLATQSICQEENHFEKNILLSEYSDNSSQTTDDQNVPGGGTIHYISPATMSVLSDGTELEGEPVGYTYKSPSFMQDLHNYDKESSGSTTISCVEPELQRTLAIVKPDAMEFEDVIVRAIKDAGLTIIYKRYIHLTPEQASELYTQHYGSPSFPHIVVKMSVGPILSLCLAGLNAVDKWKKMIGQNHVINSKWFFPISMRVRFGLRENIPDALHASENLSEATKEIKYINPECIIEPIIIEADKVADYCNLHINPTLLRGLAEVVRVKPSDPICFLADWLLKNNPHQPQFPDAIALLAT